MNRNEHHNCDAGECPSRRILFHDLNLARHIANHLLGERHTLQHRMMIGVVIMLAGVLISKLGESIPLVHILTDMSGYLVHGLGSIPFAERLAKIIRE